MEFIAALNPNLQALFFTVCFAWLVVLCIRLNSNAYLFWGLLIIFTGISLYLKSVTGLVSVFAVFYYARHNIIPYKGKYLLLVLIAGISFIINRASVTGRMHILKINMNVLSRSFPGSISPYHYAYNHEQIEHFGQNGLSAHVAYTADEGGYALNDVLQMTIMHGLPGALVMLALYIVFFYALLEGRKRPKVKKIILPLLPFYIFLPFSYPLQIPYLAFCFIILHILLLLYFISTCWPGRLAVIIRHTLLACVAAFSVLFARQVQLKITYENKMNKAIGLWDAGFHATALTRLGELKEQLPFDKKFIFYRSKYMHLSGRNKEAIAFLTTHHEYGCGYDYHILLGDAYNEMADIPLAAGEYTRALFLVPHKLESRYKLMELYWHAGKTDSAIYFAKQVLTVKIKADNPRSRFYTSAATTLLNNRL